MSFSHKAIMAARQVLWDAKQAGNFDTFDVTVAMLNAATNIDHGLPTASVVPPSVEGAEPAPVAQALTSSRGRTRTCDPLASDGRDPRMMPENDSGRQSDSTLNPVEERPNGHQTTVSHPSPSLEKP